jgi:SOS-response transcriptional repressor LexA
MKKRDRNADAESNAIVRIIGHLLDGTGDCGAYEDERFAEWLEEETLGRTSAEERRECERAAREIANRAQSRIRAMRVGEAIPSRPIRTRRASVVGNAKQVSRIAMESRCAPWVESLPVAAGIGREIWDEPCEQWVELPDIAAGGEHIALTVAGDSMTPWLRNGDVILVNTQRSVARDCLVVARHGEDGYVVKHVTRCGKTALELSSFNTEYAPFTIERSPGVVIGVVVARLEHGGIEA